MYLVLIETSANQPYIFSTNKLRENIGASELTYRSGTAWVLEAVNALKADKTVLPNILRSCNLREILLDPAQNPPIDRSPAEIIVATSGKALILVKAKEAAKQLISTLTTRALREAPGLELTGVFVEVEWSEPSLGEAIKQVHQLHEQARARKPSRAHRSIRLPILEECATSGLPAGARTLDHPIQSISVVSNSKWRERDMGIQRIEQLLDQASTLPCKKLATNNSDLAGEGAWLAVIHADGNGLGEIFLNFDQYVDGGNRNYVNSLREFSLALDVCTEHAFLSALPQLGTQSEPQRDPFIPLVPLILGGDDLTVVCDGKKAIPFMHAFLRAFEDATQGSHGKSGNIVSRIAQKVFGVGRLSACAGIAIIKPHFPFSIAYQLAEKLAKEAKKVKENVPLKSQGNKPCPCSALDFHIVYDSSDVSLDTIRGKLEIHGTKLYQRPYVITPLENLSAASDSGWKWAEFHHWIHFQHRVETLLATDEETGRRQLPSSQIHDLRSGLFLGPQAADARYRLIRNRYPSLEKLVAQAELDLQEKSSPPAGESLFRVGLDDISVTALLDAYIQQVIL